MVYLIIESTQNYCKIGYSKNPKERLNCLQVSNPVELILVKVIKGNKKTEISIHNKFKDLKVRNEWFKYNKCIFDYFNGIEEFKEPEIFKGIFTSYTEMNEFLG